MKIQNSSKETKICTKCDRLITRSESRYASGCLHRHLKCEPNKLTDDDELTRLTNEYLVT